MGRCKCTYPYCSSRTLHSLDTSLLTVPRFFLETFWKRSFSVFGHTVWNSLPLSLRKMQCFTTFKTKLKIHLFHIRLCWSASVSFCRYHTGGICVCVCVCVCVRVCVCVCVWMCVWERERDSEWVSDWVCMCLSVSLSLCLSSLVCMVGVIFVCIDTVYGLYGHSFFMLSWMFQHVYLDTCCFECLLYMFCIYAFSVQLSMFHMERHSRNAHIIIIIIIIITYKASKVVFL